MDRTELANLIAEQERQALGYFGGDLANERAKALDYYNGRPLGNEVEGRSQVVSSDVFDVIEGQLPILVKMFASTSTAVEFEPVGQEDERATKQATAACNHVFYKQNNGVLILYTWFKDALLQKNGYVRWYYEDKPEVTEETYSGLTDQQLELLVLDDSVEVLEHTEYGEEGFLLHDVKVKVTKQKGVVCIDNIPPEEFVVSKDHNSIDLENAPFCAHRRKMTISDLRAMGFSTKDLDELGTDDVDGQWNEEKLARNQFAEESAPTAETSDPAMRTVWVSQGYIRADKDGDGIAELIRFTKAGNKVLEDETADFIDFAALTPIVMPHRHVGRSYADVTIDFQTINTTLWRQGLDNLYLTNNPRHAVLENQANLDDLLTSRPGGIVRERVPDAVRPLVTPFVAQHIFPMFEYIEGRKENRTGVSRYNQGTDADSLNKTAHGVQLIQNASMQRVELIARMFGETGVKRLFRGIKRTLYKSGLRKLAIRLNNQYVEVDPREWATEWDMTVNVGLGTGNKDQQLVHLNQILQVQGLLAQMGKGYLVKDENIYSTVAKMVENSGFQHVDAFITHPEAVPPEAKKQPPPPEVMKMQLDHDESMKKLMSSEKQKMADLQTTQQVEQIGASVEKYKADLQSETQRMITQMQIEAQERMKQMEIQAQAHLAVFQANNAADTESEKMSFEKQKLRATIDPKEAGLEQVVNDVTSKQEEMGHAFMQKHEELSNAFVENTKAVAETLKGVVTRLDQVSSTLVNVANHVDQTALAIRAEVRNEMDGVKQEVSRRRVKKGTFAGKPFELREE